MRRFFARQLVLCTVMSAVACSDSAAVADVDPLSTTTGSGADATGGADEVPTGTTDDRGHDTTGSDTTGSDTTGSDTDDAPDPVSPQDVRFYMQRIAPTLVGRSLSYDESTEIESQGEAAVAGILADWLDEPGFAEAIRYLVQTRLHASGRTDEIDFELPGNLAAEIAEDRLPWSTVLTADYCVDADGNHTQCDTGAPYAAGVLTTRAYLSANRGRFNLGRAKVMLEVFACQAYPMAANVQIPLDKEVLIPMFRAETAEEQEVEEAEGGFGNGIGCYLCHSQFGAHAQLFVKYDAEGRFHAAASGLQNPSDELGRSFNDLYTSHLDEPTSAASEASQMFGESVTGLREAAEVLADSRYFSECTIKNLLAASFGLVAGTSADIDPVLLSAIADSTIALASDPDDPTIHDYVAATFTDPRVLRAAVALLHAQDD